MDFSKIKTFTIPQGKVVSLSIDGVVVWQGGLKASTLSITDGVLTITNTDDRVEKFVVISNTETVLVLNADGTVAEITFTIGGTEYKALEGMTWSEWVESEYNTGGFYVGESSGWGRAIVNGETGTNAYGNIDLKAVVDDGHVSIADNTIQNKIYEFYAPVHGGGSN